ncbi:hypothetical protein [Cellulomonas sp. ATA003]|uniref:hypothetical protein n=1 Tax=Cellulomonas sp. ATA003 TaxID=3073064 RepID=UPI0028733714|nr:hypothetical protein [Cellulomonas sp. ATA003]WNB84702.1 hypothetical protein REH70_13070 [Cellulomonas sp. ATA003]
MTALAVLWVSAWFTFTAAGLALEEAIGVPDDPGFLTGIVVAINAAISLHNERRRAREVASPAADPAGANDRL